MSLPVLKLPTYTGKILSSGQPFNFKPFMVREQKIILLALESGDITTIYNALKDIIKVCVLSENINIDKMPLFDLEGVFLSIASKSTGEVAHVGKLCSECSYLNEIDVPLEGVTLKGFEPKNNRVELGENIGIILKYPTLQDAMNVSLQQNNKTNEELSFEMILSTIESVYDEKHVYSGSDYTREELTEFVETFQINHLLKIRDFISSTPYISYVGEFKCKNCGAENKYEVKGIQDFFV